MALNTDRTTAEIANIDKAFPVAGRDNDTGGFRSNFTSISTSLSYINQDIISLNTTTAKTNADVSFNGWTLSNAILRNMVDTAYTTSVTSSPYTVDFENGYFQTLEFNSSISPPVVIYFNIPDTTILTLSTIKLKLKNKTTNDLSVKFVGVENIINLPTDTLKIPKESSKYCEILRSFDPNISGTNKESISLEVKHNQFSDLSGVGISDPAAGQILQYNGSTWVNASSFKGSVDVSGNSSITFDGHAVSYITTTQSAGESLALPQGSEGQIHTIILKGKPTTGGNLIVTVGNRGWVGSGNITFNAVGHSCTVQYIQNKWYIIGSYGVAIS